MGPRIGSSDWRLPLLPTANVSIIFDIILLIFGHEIGIYFIMKIWRETGHRSPKVPPSKSIYLPALSQKQSYVSFLLSKSNPSTWTLSLFALLMPPGGRNCSV